MKYCAKCGAQMADEAMLCVTCGCMVEGAFAKVPARSASVPSLKKKEKSGEGISSFEVVSFLHSALSMLAVFSMVIAMILVEVYTYRGVTVLPNLVCMIVALAMSMLSVVSAVICLIIGAQMPQARERLIGLLRIIASLLLTVAAILGVVVILSY